MVKVELLELGEAAGEMNVKHWSAAKLFPQILEGLGCSGGDRHEQRGGNAEPCGELGDLADVQVAFARQDLRHHTLTADLGHVGLSEFMVLHQAVQNLRPGGVGHSYMGILIGLDREGQGLSQVSERMGFLLADFIQNVIEDGNSSIIFRLGM